MIVRAGMTETINAFAAMPAKVAALPELGDRLDAVRQANLDHHGELIAQAATRGVRVLCLGELFAAPYFALSREPMWQALAEDAESGPTRAFVGECARRHSLIIVAPIYELDPGSGERFNTALVIDERGELLGRYRKTHIPAGGNEDGVFDETFYYRASDGAYNQDSAAVVSTNPFFPVFRTSVGELGVATCYDRHFEGAISSLARGGAKLVFSPAVTFGQKSRRVWDLEFLVDAARHNLFIGGSNRRGSEPPWNQEFFGESYFAGPGGKLENVSDHRELVIADIDLDAPERGDAAGWDLSGDARPEIYG